MWSNRESPRHRAIFSFLALAVLLAAVLLTLALITPPAPLPADAPATAFSARRAMEDLAIIARDPHPMGQSPAHDAVRDYLLDEIRSLGLEPEVQATFGVRVVHAGWVLAGAVENILVRLPGTDPEGAILLLAHYDTAPGVPGAADNGTGVVALLELLRALRAGPRLRQDVIFFFTDGEEPGTIGTHAFVSQHPWLGDVKLAINMDTLVEGPAILRASAAAEVADALVGLAGTGRRCCRRPQDNLPPSWDAHRRSTVESPAILW
jgi:acetylornithine deacetylase/succinyl-diaminopimelate desuccinylase-like protein